MHETDNYFKRIYIGSSNFNKNNAIICEKFTNY